MNSFYPLDNGDGTWRVECRCIIYRELHGVHPDWAKPVGNAKEGYNTKYFLLVEDDLSELSANEKAAEYNEMYGNLLTACENSGNWDDFPFTNRPIVYYK